MQPADRVVVSKPVSSSISLPVIKQLFAVSCNVCAFPSCEERLTDPSWESVNAHICHIAGEKPGAARFDDPTISLEDRQGFDNLILLCPNHHRRIDSLEPSQYSVDDLVAMKQRAINRCEDKTWASDEDLQKFAVAALALAGAIPAVAAEQTRLVAAIEDGKVIVRNVGDADALRVSVKAPEEAAFLLGDDAWDVLSPGAAVQAAHHTPNFANQGKGTFLVRWHDADGVASEAQFPLG